MSIIPTHFNYVRVFTARETHHRREDGLWVRVRGLDPPLHDEINKWVDETHVQLTVVQSPSVTVIQDEETVREYLFSVSVMYIRPSEGDEDALQRASDSRDRPATDDSAPGGEMGRVAKPPEPKSKEAAESGEQPDETS